MSFRGMPPQSPQLIGRSPSGGSMGRPPSGKSPSPYMQPMSAHPQLMAHMGAMAMPQQQMMMPQQQMMMPQQQMMMPQQQMMMPQQQMMVPQQQMGMPHSSPILVPYAGSQPPASYMGMVPYAGSQPPASAPSPRLLSPKSNALVVAGPAIAQMASTRSSRSPPQSQPPKQPTPPKPNDEPEISMKRERRKVQRSAPAPPPASTQSGTKFSILNDAPTPDAHSNDPLPLITMDGRSSDEFPSEDGTQTVKRSTQQRVQRSAAPPPTTTGAGRATSDTGADASVSGADAFVSGSSEARGDASYRQEVVSRSKSVAYPNYSNFSSSAVYRAPPTKIDHYSSNVSNYRAPPTKIDYYSSNVSNYSTNMSNMSRYSTISTRTTLGAWSNASALQVRGSTIEGDLWGFDGRSQSWKRRRFSLNGLSLKYKSQGGDAFTDSIPLSTSSVVESCLDDMFDKPFCFTIETLASGRAGVQKHLFAADNAKTREYWVNRLDDVGCTMEANESLDAAVKFFFPGFYETGAGRTRAKNLDIYDSGRSMYNTRSTYGSDMGKDAFGSNYNTRASTGSFDIFGLGF